MSAKALAPIKMLPAYRFGSMTPWGGDSLKTLFNRDIPDPKTGESLEVSCLDNLSSTDENGTTLKKLIELYEERLLGTKVDKPFPLLLKLISARDKLSVQVHPDNDYALKKEKKLGKTEAWLILDAAPDAHIVYGIKKGISKEKLQNAFLNRTEDISSLLRYVPVKAGDAFYIPAGTVHAIGAGITLYEIQQSSDVTYRFYDWDRADSLGNKRELHIEDALNVSNIKFSDNAIVPKTLPLKEGSGKLEEIFNTPYFITHRYTDCQNALIENTPEYFKMLTFISPGTISWESGSLNLNSGDTVLLPAMGFDVFISSKLAVVSMPSKG
ncbi:MAG: class I mannose-6-phosphate isomerase [Eubacteriales bacterium]|nr:class I mannose-6-phosphate isomerase [Eubacteriales bacterium]